LDTHAPVEPATYAFLAKFLAEVTTIFPEQNLFLGGDEVSGECWSVSVDLPGRHEPTQSD
jgi:N-acetyl-beta-hexosaminidase